ncbi:MAG: hypothetical protein IPL52_11480 [Flavobacteriales bacterium]|nr:hypothetical protein [Flavobacteriales bacterium]
MRTSIIVPIVLICLGALPERAAAQRFDDGHPPNTYRNADNPFYWKNRPPHEGYWQQDVHYLIKGRMDDGRDVLDGELTLYYHNNSPDTLRHRLPLVPGSLRGRQLQPGSRGRAMARHRQVERLCRHTHPQPYGRWRLRFAPNRTTPS